MCKELARLSKLVALIACVCTAQTKQPTPDQIQSSLLADLRGDDPDASGPYGTLLGSRIDIPYVNPGGGVRAGVISVEELGHKTPKVAKKWFRDGARLAQKGDHPGAVADFKKAIGLDHDFAQAHHRLGVEYAFLGRLTEAEAELRTAVRIQPHAIGPGFDLSVLLYRKGDFQDAERAVKHVLDLSMTTPPAHLLLGMILVGRDPESDDGIAQIRYAARTMPEAQEILDKILRH